MHLPVLLQETIEYLDPQPGEIIVDGTINRGGHAKVIAERVGSTGTLIGIDQDPLALAEVAENLKSCSAKTIFANGNFRNVKTIVNNLGIAAVDGVFLDIGFSSNQLEDSNRGFSFQVDEPLLMTFGNPEEALVTAQDIVNTWGEENLADIIYGFGEETFARRIAHEIASARRDGEINTTFELIEIIRKAVPVWYTKKRIHFATRTFQAIRMAVNDELGALKEGIDQAFAVLKPGGRLAIISFHSLEARIIKDRFKQLVVSGAGELVTKKAIKPSRAEEIQNPRSRSAQLRVIKKI